MKQRDQLPPAGKMPLPSPRSPAELDQRILDMARERAPAGSARSYRGWSAGLATVGVVVVAVLIATPQDPSPDMAPELTGKKEQVVERSRSLDDAQLARQDSAESFSAAEVPAAAAAAPAAKQRIEPEPIAIAEVESIAEEDRAVATALRQSTAADSPVSNFAADADIATGASMNEGDASAPAYSKAKTGRDKSLLDELESCAAQQQAEGGSAAARVCYESLRRRYPDADLPDELEAALAQHRDN